MSRRSRLVVLALVVLSMLAAGSLGAARPVLAHAEFLGSEPGDGEIVDQAPAEVVLHFSEGVTPLPDGNRVADASGAEVSTGVSGNGADVSIALQDGLADGSYVVTWGVISADDHPVRGSFVFHVGAPTPGVSVAPVETGSPRWITVGEAAVHWWGLVATFIAGGLALFIVAVHDGQPDEQRLLRRVAIVAAVYGLAHLPVAVAFQAAAIAGGDSGFTDGDAINAAWDSHLGTQEVVIAVGLMVALAGLLAWRSRLSLPAAAVGGLIAAAAFGIAGHSATTDPRWLGTVADGGHAIAAAAWFGGLIGLAVILALRRGIEGADATPVVRRFSTLALVSVAIIAILGVVLAWAIVPGWRVIYEETWGRLLIAKVAVVIAVVALAAYNRRRLVRRLGTEPDAGAQLLRSVRWEILGILVILGFTVALAQEPPEPASGSSSATNTAAIEPYIAEGLLGSAYHVIVTVEPERNGVRTIEADFHSLGDANPADIRSVELRFEHEQTGNAPIVREMETAQPGSGVYRYDSADMVFPGDWTITLAARISDFDQESFTFTLPAGR
jgi:copper transport protein